MVDWGYISELINMREVKLNPHEPWDRDTMSYNGGLTLDVVLDLDMPEATGEWDWRDISGIATMDDIRSNPGRPWNRRSLSYNRDLTIDVVTDLVMPEATDTWRWEGISSVVPIQDVRDNPLLTWDMDGLSNNKQITINDIFTLVLPNSTHPTDLRRYDDEYFYSDDEWAVRGWNDQLITPTPYWNWSNLSTTLPSSVINANPDLPWRREYIWNDEQVLPLTRDIILADTNESYHWDDIVRAEGITMRDLLYMDLPNVRGEIDWSYVAENFPIEDVRSNYRTNYLDEVGLNPGAALDDFL